MDTRMKMIDEFGKELNCNVIAIFYKDEKNYIAYTDGTGTDGKLDILVSNFKIDGSKTVLSDIEESDWPFVENYLEENLSDGDYDD